MATKSHAYGPLKGRGQIRLFHSYRANDGVIHVSLQPHELSSPGCPAYTAFSYVWGQPKPNQNEITVNGETYPVLDSVYQILEALCDGLLLPTTRWCWIDFICINQADRDERASQVQLMRDIYTQCSATIIWLGTSTDTSSAAVDFLVTLVANFDAVAQHHAATKLRTIPPSAHPDLRSPHAWESLQALLARPWFTRVWTLQELILPRTAGYVCGEKTISKSTMEEAMCTVWLCNPPEPWIASSAWLAVWHRIRLCWWYHSPGGPTALPLPALLAYTATSFSTDPRDRLYSLLGLATDADRSVVGTPTYGHATEEVYRRYVVSFVRIRMSLDIICFAPLFRPAAGSAAPSWVPDWRRVVTLPTVPVMVSQSALSHIGNFRPPREMLPPGGGTGAVYAAAGGQSPAVDVVGADGTVLRCAGYLVDVVADVGELWVEDAEQAAFEFGFYDPEALHAAEEPAESSPTAGGGAAAVVEVLRALVRTAVLDRNDRYLQVPAKVDVLCDTLIALLRVARAGDERIYGAVRHFRTWLDGNARLVVRGRTLGDVLVEVETLPYLQAKKPDGHVMLNFLGRVRDTAGSLHMSKRLAVMEQGHVGMVAREGRKGDVIAVLLGCSVPVALRKNGVGDNHYELVGEAYVDGFMNGEILSAGKASRLWTIS